MTNKLKYTALAILFAGVFIVNFSCCSAYAQQSLLTWNVDVSVEYDGDVFRYDLLGNIRDCVDQADERGFYCGAREKARLAEQLLGLGLPVCSVCEYILPGFTKITERFGYVNRSRKDAQVVFSSDGFEYLQGCDGVEIDCKKLFYLMLSSNGRYIRVDLPLSIDKAVSVQDLKRNTAKRGSFTTTYYASGANRCDNIALAVKALNGITVGVGEMFSFNNAVGPRTEQNGYKTSKVILDGNYVEGVGGGVCQVSTTLYNALLLANFIPSAAQHSLVSSYVMAGFDAMVAYGATDLTFVNNTEHNVYIQGAVKDKTVTFTVYGEPNPYKIIRENVEQRQPFDTVEIVDKVKYPELVYSDQTKVIVGGSDGVKSKSYLKYCQNGQVVATRLIRTNTYKKVDKVIARGELIRDGAAN